MKQRRRLSAVKSRPITAIVLAATLVASAVIGISGTRVLQTQGDGIDPIDASLTTSSLTEGENVVVDDPAITAQGEGDAARTVKQFTQDEPFSQFALTWTGNKDVAVFARGQRDDGSWTDWYDTDPMDYGGGDAETKKGTDLIYLEPTKTVQVSMSGVDLYDNQAIKDLEAVFINGGESEIPETSIDLAADSDGLPKVVSRKGWGADESIRCKEPSFADGVIGLTVHHTAGSNNYSAKEAPGIVRGIYKYHAQTLGWCDIGYHVLADKYGKLYEGHYGGLNKDVIGVHAGGFNMNTWAVSMLGNYSTAQPSKEMINSVGEILGWRAKVEGLDPTGKNYHISEGTQYSKYPQGTRVELPNIFAHRDVGTTECPGNHAYAKMDQIRATAKKKAGSISSSPSRPSNNAPATTTKNAAPTSQASPAGNNTNNGSANGAVKLLQMLQGSSSDNSNNAVSSLIKLAIGIASAIGLLPGTVSNLGNIKVIDGLNLGMLPGFLDKVIPLSGNTDLAKLWKTLSPILGNARSEEVTYTNGNGKEVTYALFENGIIIGSPETGLQPLWGAIGDTWAAQGLDMGPLGLPLGQEYQDGNLLRVDFEYGYITYDPATGKVDVHHGQ